MDFCVDLAAISREPASRRERGSPLSQCTIVDGKVVCIKKHFSALQLIMVCWHWIYCCNKIVYYCYDYKLKVCYSNTAI